MNAAHPEACPEIVELAGILGLGLSPMAEQLLVPTDQSVEQILLWIESCPTCTDHLETLEAWQEEVGYPDFAVVAHERSRARELWAKLEKLPTGELANHLGEEHGFWAMAQLLADKGSDEAHRCAERAVRLSEMALDVALGLDESHYTPRLVADQRARSWAMLGNSQKVVGHFRLAGASFSEALASLRKGTGAPFPEGLVLTFLGSFLISRFRSEEALKVLEKAADLLEICGSTDLLAKANIMLANIDSIRGDFRGGVARLTRLQNLLDSTAHRSLMAMCQHQLTHLLTEAGLYEEAELRVELTRRLYVDSGEHSNQLRLRWVEARVHRGLGRVGEAEKALLEVIEGLTHMGREAEVGLAKLDLACLFCGQRNFDEVERLSQQSLAIFRTVGASAEALAALSLVNGLAQTKQLTGDTILRLIRYLGTPGSDRRGSFSP